MTIVHCASSVWFFVKANVGEAFIVFTCECHFRLASSEVCLWCTRGDQASALGVQGCWRGDAGQKASALETGMGHLYTQEPGQLWVFFSGVGGGPA